MLEVSVKIFCSNVTYNFNGWMYCFLSGGLLSIFAVATKPVAARQYFLPPVIPKDYQPVHSTTQSSEEQQNVQPRQTEKKNHLTVAERGQILGETPIPAPKKSVFEYIAKEDKQRLKDTLEFKELESGRNSAGTGHQTAGGSSTFKPFVKEPRKQERYERYLRIRGGQQDTIDLPDRLVNACLSTAT